MPVALPATQTPLTTDDIRLFLRDMPDYNITLDGHLEFEEKDIQAAIRLTLAKWNAITPMSNVTDPAQLNAYVLLCGVCSLLLKSEGLRQMRNQIQTQEGNISPVGLDEKEALYMRWAVHFQEEFNGYAQRIKIQQNMESLLGPYNGTSSGYAGLHRRY